MFELEQPCIGDSKSIELKITLCLELTRIRAKFILKKELFCRLFYKNLFVYNFCLFMNWKEAMKSLLIVCN